MVSFLFGFDFIFLNDLNILIYFNLKYNNKDLTIKIVYFKTKFGHINL